MNPEIQRIIEVTNELTREGSTSEQIAAAFILNDMAKLPAGYTVVVEAWARLGDWQGYVQLIRTQYGHLLVKANDTKCV